MGCRARVIEMLLWGARQGSQVMSLIVENVEDNLCSLCFVLVCSLCSVLRSRIPVPKGRSRWLEWGWKGPSVLRSSNLWGSGVAFYRTRDCGQSMHQSVLCRD